MSGLPDGRPAGGPDGEAYWDAVTHRQPGDTVRAGVDSDLPDNRRPTRLHDREAFRSLFSYGGTLAGLSGKAVSNLPAATRFAALADAKGVCFGEFLDEKALDAYEREVERQRSLEDRQI
jgi:hypothetical protein